MLMGLFLHFYIIFGTNLLTPGPVQIAVFFAYFSVSQKRNIKRSPNGMKPSGALFLEQTWSRRLGVDVKKETWQPRGREARPGGRRAPTLVGPSWLPWPTSFAYIYSYTLNTSRSTTKPYFHRRNSLYLWDPILEPFPALRRSGNQSRRASSLSLNLNTMFSSIFLEIYSM